MRILHKTLFISAQEEGDVRYFSFNSDQREIWRMHCIDGLRNRRNELLKRLNKYNQKEDAK